MNSTIYLVFVQYNNYEIKSNINYMLNFQEDLLIYLTQYLNISDYKKIISTNSQIRDIFSKNKNKIWFNIINGTKNFSISERKDYYTIHILKNKNSYCISFPNKLDIKENFMQLYKNYYL